MITCGRQKNFKMIGAALGLWGFIVPGAIADVRVSGTSDAIVLEAHAAPMDEVLRALESAFDLKYRTAEPLNHLITGTYTGSVQRVLSRLLDGHDFIIQSSDGSMSVIIFSAVKRERGGGSVPAIAESPGMKPQRPDVSAPTRAPPPAAGGPRGRRPDPETPNEKNVF